MMMMMTNRVREKLSVLSLFNVLWWGGKGCFVGLGNTQGTLTSVCLGSEAAMILRFNTNSPLLRLKRSFVPFCFKRLWDRFNTGFYVDNVLRK